MVISKSPGRMTFQKERYIHRCNEKNEIPNPEYLEMFDDDMKRHDTRFDDPTSKVYNLEYDLLTTEWILEKVRNSEVYAQNLYASMCNTDFVKNDVWPILTNKKWSCSWRYAGGIIADMRKEGDYINWYCSGITRDLTEEELKECTAEQLKRYEVTKYFVGEGHVTDEIRQDLLKLGWIVIDDDSAE